MGVQFDLIVYQDLLVKYQPFAGAVVSHLEDTL